MAKIINSSALEPANKALGIAGSGDSQTELLDATVDQVLDVGQIARRGGTLAGTEGVFRVVLRTNHTDVETVATSFQPYSPGTGVVAPYPDPVPDGFDIWLLATSLERVSGGGSISAAELRLTNVQQGFGVDDAGVAVVSTSVFHLTFWDALEGGMSPAFGNIVNQAKSFQKVGIRIPRKGAIASPFIVFSAASTGSVVIDALMLLGIFPVSLGQDIAV